MKKRQSFFKSILIATVSLFCFIPQIIAADVPSGITVGPPVAEYTLEPGQTVSGIVKVNDYAPAPVKLYPQTQDFAAKNESGEPAFFEIDPNRKYSLSDWVKFSPEPLELTVGELRAIPYQIVVPTDAEPGGHYGVLFFSTKSPNDVKEGEAKVAADLKVGQLILVRVAGEVKEKGLVEEFTTKHLFNWFPQVQYSNEKLLSFSSRIDFITRLKNDGNVHYKPQGKITVKNLFGQKLGEMKFNEKEGNVLPETIRKFDNTWDTKWWRMGIYKADLDLAYGTSGQTLTDHKYFVIIPWWLKVIGIGVLIFIIYKIRKRKKARRG